MKFAILQFPYSLNFTDAETLFEENLKTLDQCDESMDVIVLPEYCDLPVYSRTTEEFQQNYDRFNARILQKCKETAVRCNAMVFVNATYADENNCRHNTTHAINRQGEIVGRYYKIHPTAGEVRTYGIDPAHSEAPIPPTVVEMEGIRFGFLTCYDFYFYEQFAHIARQNVDVIIGCSHQRSDLQSALENMSCFCAYNTNAYVVRASVSMGADTDIGGGSLIASPKGLLLANMKSETGIATAEFDPHDKYYKPAGFGNPDAAHYEYVEIGRRAWTYRPAGSAIALPDRFAKFPRVCAHRGFKSVAPDNSLVSLGAAVSAGADEIEFGLWLTRDGEVVSVAEPDLALVSNGSGMVWEKTLEEIKAMDFGSQFAAPFAGMTAATLKEILQKFSCHTIMNIFIGTNGEREEELLTKILALIDRYDCRQYVYLTAADASLLKKTRALDAAVPLCFCQTDDTLCDAVAVAKECDCTRVQFSTVYATKERVQAAHNANLKVGIYCTNTPEEAKTALAMGADTLLTDDYYQVAKAVQ